MNHQSTGSTSAATLEAPAVRRAVQAPTDRRRRNRLAGAPAAAGDDQRLRTRDDFLWELGGVLAGTWEHPTGAIVVEGMPGLGKTAMVNAGCHLATGLGLRVFKARADEGETEIAFGLAHQLLTPVIRKIEAEGDPSEETEALITVLRTGLVHGIEMTELFRRLTALLMQRERQSGVGGRRRRALGRRRISRLAALPRPALGVDGPADAAQQPPAPRRCAR